MATLDELKRSLGTPVGLTVFRKLQQLDYLTSYSDRARYYTARQIARFDAEGLWSHEAVWFSRHGTLLATAEAWVNIPRAHYPTTGLDAGPVIFRSVCLLPHKTPPNWNYTIAPNL